MPFDHIQSPDQYLLTLADGDHMIFGGHSNQLKPEQVVLYKNLICESSMAFWDAYLKNDAKAKVWLTSDFKTELTTNGTFEIKPPK